MATQRLAGGFQPTSKRVADEPSPSQRHAKKPKKTVSVAGLFAKRPRPEREKIASTDGITRKQPTAEELLTARAKRDPIYLDVKHAADAYRSGEAGSTAEQLDAVHEELIARIKGMDINGKPLNIPGLPSDAALRAMQDDASLWTPLEDDIVTISVTKPDGTAALKHVRLGDSVQKLEKLIDDSSEKLTRLGKELDEVNEEINATLGSYNKATDAVDDVFKEKITKYQADVRNFHQWTIEEITKARKEDKAYSVEVNRKLQEFTASLIT